MPSAEAAQTLAEVQAEVMTAEAVAAPLVTSALPISFVMTLQNTDVGKGQKTPGASARSAEVFIPLAALDAHPDFWGFPQLFKSDTKWNAAHPKIRRNGIGKVDRWNVPMRVGMVQKVNMFFNPNKRDLRLRHEKIRSSGKIGDIIWIQRVDPASGFEYDVQVAPKGTPMFNQLLPQCDHFVRNSKKQFGYF